MPAARDPWLPVSVRICPVETSVTQHSRNTPQFYLTAPSPCPYLPGQEERKVFTHLVGERAAEFNDLLTHGGFRRSQSIAYRPACELAVPASRCGWWPRIPAHAQHATHHGTQSTISLGTCGSQPRPPSSIRCSVPTRDSRHRDGGMADMTVLDYAMMVEDSHVETRMVEYRHRAPDSSITGRGTGTLLAVALTDVLNDGLSMVYSFFDPEWRHVRSAPL